MRSAISGIDHGVSADRKGGGEEDVVIGAKETSPEGAEERVRYNWEEEWYPLYLTDQVPDDAPVGLTVFDKQVVLYRDGKGVLRCYEDRCPHRCILWQFPLPLPSYSSCYVLLFVPIQLFDGLSSTDSICYTC